MGKKQKRVSEQRLSCYFDLLEEDLLYANPQNSEGSYAVERQFDRCRKKAIYVRRDLEEKAAADFAALNTRLGALRVDLPRDVLQNARLFITRALEGFTKKHVPESIQETLDYGVMFDHWRFGTGAACLSDDGETIVDHHPATKMVNGMTSTSDARDLVLMLRRNDSYFRSYDSKADEFFGMVSLVQGSRFRTVPKNQTAVRPIATEPTGNMCLQLAAGEYITGALRWVGLDISTQQAKNRELARQGSMCGTLATLDLKDASSMQTPQLIELVWPSKWFNLFMRLRSPKIEMQKGVWIEANMISTMGNGFTFPMMTMTILALLYGYRCCRGGPSNRIDWSITGVYGDDIILKACEADEFIDILHRSGYVVNREKSFVGGPFRESCGGDYKSGVDVTPFYVKNLQDDADVFTAMNQQLKWSAKVGVVLYRPLRYLKSLLEGKCHLVPEWCADDAGVKTQECPSRYSYLHPKQKWRRHAGACLSRHHFDMKLCVGGYAVQQHMVRLPKWLMEKAEDTDLFYLPRPDKTWYGVRKARIPEGFRDGSFPLERNAAESSYIALLVKLVV